MNVLLAAAWIGTLVHGWTGEVKRYELIRDAGIGILRCEIQWKDCEKKKGEYILPDHVEEELKIMKQFGIRPNVLLTYDNPELYPENPLDPQAFGNWACWLVNRIKPWADDFEIFNEGWSFGFRKRYGDKWVDEFVKFSRHVAEMIHMVRPDATVIVAAEDGWSALHDMLCKHIGLDGEVVSFHPYIRSDKSPRPEGGDLFWNDDGKAMRDIAWYGGRGAKRFRITEIGWTTWGLAEHKEGDFWKSEKEGYGVSLETQARYIIRAYVIAYSCGVEAIMQYDFHDDGPYRGHCEHNYGLVFEDYSPKPSYRAVQTLDKMVGKAKPMGDIGGDRAKKRVYKFRQPDGSFAYVAWAVEGKAEFTASELAGKKIFDLYGKEVGKVPETGTISLSEAPAYVR